VKPYANPAIAQVFKAYPPNIRRKLLVLRERIFAVAVSTKGVGNIEETLKWGEPAYVTTESRSGSTIRIAWKATRPKQYGMYFNCQTSLVDTFRTLFPVELKFEGNRAIIFDGEDKVPIDALRLCIAAALTYHRRTSRHSTSTLDVR
jgi:Domain of unknown function (DU1801)